MSTSTIFIKRPLNYRQSLAMLKQKYDEFSPFISVILWIFSGLYSASQTAFNSNVTGLTLSFPVYDLLLMSFSSTLLYQGLNNKNIMLLLPWLIVTLYGLYFNHYQGLLSTLGTLKRVKNLSWLAWSNLTVNIFLLIIRGTLTIRIFQLCVHLWFKKKLNEMKEKQF